MAGHTVLFVKGGTNDGVSWEWEALGTFWSSPQSSWWIRFLKGAPHRTCICDILYISSQWDLCQATKISAVLEISISRTFEGTFKPKTWRCLKNLCSSRIRYSLGRMSSDPSCRTPEVFWNPQTGAWIPSLYTAFTNPIRNVTFSYILEYLFTPRKKLRCWE